jgi:hypothetical protein
MTYQVVHRVTARLRRWSTRAGTARADIVTLEPDGRVSCLGCGACGGERRGVTTATRRGCAPTAGCG